MKCQRCS